MNTVKLTRVHAGSYTYAIRNITFQIYKQTERDCSWYGEWIIVGNDNYSDPIETLRDCRAALAEMKLKPSEYGIN